MNVVPIVTQLMTNEGRGSIRIYPDPGGHPGLFPIQDPFGLRRAVNPVFVQAMDGVVPMGTGFHVDLSGAFATAEHVAERGRVALGHFSRLANKEFSMAESDPHIVALLGGWTGFGTIKVPDWAWVRATNVVVPIDQRSDPLRDLQGGTDTIIAADVAALQFSLSKQQAPATLPIRLSGRPPEVGDRVVAVGFPELTFSGPFAPSSLKRLSEGMHGAYGEVVAIHPMGRDRANPGPCIEVSADWPPGMSGGPVFNEAGEVIGIVSRSLRATDDHPGVGWATCLPLAPGVRPMMPSVSPERPLERLIVIERAERPSDGFNGPGL